MENIKAIQLITEEKGLVIHCHHNVNVSLAVLIGIFEGYGSIKLIEPLYSFQGTRIGTTKVYYVYDRDADIAVSSITAIGNKQQQNVIRKRTESDASVDSSKGQKQQGEPTLRRPTGTIPKADRSTKNKDNKIDTQKSVSINEEFEEIEIDATDETPFYAIHEEGRKVHIQVPTGHDFDSIFQEMRPYGEIEYIHELINKDQRQIALICYYDRNSALKAMKTINPVCKPKWAQAQRIIDYKGKLYRLHEECNRKVSAINFAKHRRTCELENEYYRKNNENRTNQHTANIDNNPRKIEDEEKRRIIINITPGNSIKRIQQEFEKYGPLEYIYPNLESKIAYICYFNAESTYKAIIEADEQYHIRLAGAETLIGFKGPLKRQCTRCHREVSSPHIGHHLAICREGLLKPIAPKDRIHRARERVMEPACTTNSEIEKSQEENYTADTEAIVRDLIDFQIPDSENEESEINSFKFVTNNYANNEDIDEDSDDDRSVIIEGSIAQNLRTPETKKENISPFKTCDNITHNNDKMEAKTSAKAENIEPAITKEETHNTIDEDKKENLVKQHQITSNEMTATELMLIGGKIYVQRKQNDGKIILVPVEEPHQYDD